jgi:hypothetical protein
MEQRGESCRTTISLVSYLPLHLDMRFVPRFLILGMVLSASCSRSTSTAPVEVRPGQSLPLKQGDAAQVHGTPVIVRIAGINESRCPSDVVCIQAGDAAVVLELSGAGGERTDTLYLRRQPHGVTYGAYRFDLADVQPYPISTRRDVAQVATLRLSSAE